MHTTNYTNTFIACADDCPVETGCAPPEKEPPTIAWLQYEIIRNNPYRFTSDDVVFLVHLARSGLDPSDSGALRAEFFSKGHACLRSSPLAKRYGWGIYHDADSRVAIYPRGSAEYERLSQDPTLKQAKAMKNAR
ncbi:MAG TPA: DUF6157 family protein [Longimicrobiales bacterium]|nr:DUF6157 family protein [Longimicrobiales bacterium]